MAALFLTTGTAWAHHSLISQYAKEKTVSLRGTVTRVVWKNPHGWIYIDVPGESGQREQWMIETGAPLRMQRRGLKATDFKVGAEVIIGGWAARDGSKTVAGWIVTFVDRETKGQEASFALGR
ncbi:MAG: hypothetical protein A3G76_00565 [Acidobacteria bacterium RIFCSPLOWO2_12_FULL_65_11]|nr:MAG: hypothetical protein A3H95_06900 [Acidobacteria bacterium RIFCSPLOWO2_02_FULL_64_15]OFW34155.1 MAG: hypothetical protein A3G76_00565 [Acidobacteria bacterium RIFCSPLOWO2_12_FULL_65_11]